MAIVTLSENDLYYTGGTIIFDHGHGVSTLYMHMDKIFVKDARYHPSPLLLDLNLD